MYIKEVGFEVVDWVRPDQDTVPWRLIQNTIMNLRVPWKMH